MTSVKTILHHGWGGTLMLAGIYFNKPFLWRHGMLTEAGGLDIYEFVGLLRAKFSSGNWPFSEFVKNTGICGVLITHHLVGSSICFPLCIYYSDNYEF